MTLDFLFFMNSILLGFGLAMDAFSVSLANGLNESSMKFPRMSSIAGCYGFFQFFMPLIGWLFVHKAVEYFSRFEKFIPYIALILLLYIGIDMLVEGLKRESEDSETGHVFLSFGKLLIQGLATSIDALSVGFTISEYDFSAAFIASVIIAVVTYIICMLGLVIGKKVGTKISGKASVLGGVVLIVIGFEIFIRGIF